MSVCVGLLNLDVVASAAYKYCLGCPVFSQLLTIIYYCQPRTLMNLKKSQRDHTVLAHVLLISLVTTLPTPCSSGYLTLPVSMTLGEASKGYAAYFIHLSLFINNFSSTAKGRKKNIW